MSPEPPDKSAMLKDVMVHAYASHYRGEGHLWGYDPTTLADAIESGAYLRVLRSEEFCRSYWRIRIVVQQVPTGSTGTGLVPQHVSEDEIVAWERHHAKLQTEADPLTYCFVNAN